MNFILLTHEEMQRLDQHEPMLWVAYLKVKQHMNTKTRITGIERKITHQWLAEHLTQESRQGRAKKCVTKEQARYLIKKMEEAGLVQRLSQRFSDGIILRHLLTATEKTPDAEKSPKIENSDNNEPSKHNDGSSKIWELFTYWCETHHHPNATLSQRERQRLRCALQEGYTVDECRQAIDGCRRSPFHQGDNRQGVRYDSLTLIFRDREHIDRFIQLSKPTQQNTRMRSTTHSSNNYGANLFAEAFEAEYGSRLPEGNPLLWHKNDSLKNNEPIDSDIFENDEAINGNVFDEKIYQD